MGDFTMYFTTGWHHIVSWNALDHILFIVVLAAIYLVADWRQVLILVTAFTIGHSLTLALSVYDVIRFDSGWVEFLIPCTIITTAVFNLIGKTYPPKNISINYSLALLFGLIHGMGFANTIRFMLAEDQGILVPLISFNLGLELGQVVVVAIILATAYCVVNKANFSRRWWVIALSGAAMIIALGMAKERWPLL